MRFTFGIREACLVLALFILGLLVFFKYEAQQYYREQERLVQPKPPAPVYNFRYCCRLETT